MYNRVVQKIVFSAVSITLYRVPEVSGIDSDPTNLYKGHTKVLQDSLESFGLTLNT